MIDETTLAQAYLASALDTVLEMHSHIASQRSALHKWESVGESIEKAMKLLGMLDPIGKYIPMSPITKMLAVHDIDVEATYNARIDIEFERHVRAMATLFEQRDAYRKTRESVQTE